MEIVFYADVLDTTNPMVVAFLASPFSMCLCTQDDAFATSFLATRGVLPSRVITPTLAHLDPIAIVLQSDITLQTLTESELQAVSLNAIASTSSRMKAMLQLFATVDSPLAAFSLQGPIDLRHITPYQGAIMNKKIIRPYLLKTDTSSTVCVVTPTNIFSGVLARYIQQSESTTSILTTNYNFLTASTIVQLATIDKVLEGVVQIQPGGVGEVLESFLTRGIILDEKRTQFSRAWIVCGLLMLLLFIQSARSRY